MADSPKREFNFEKAEIGEDLGSYEYVLRQESVDSYRASVEDPDAPFVTIGIKHDTTALEMAFDDQVGGILARSEVEFYNAPVAGKKIFVTARIADKYWRRDKPYLVTEATATDEDGRLLEIVRSYEVKKPDELGKKWQ
jgi:hypothetical protein